MGVFTVTHENNFRQRKSEILTFPHHFLIKGGINLCGVFIIIIKEDNGFLKYMTPLSVVFLLSPTTHLPVRTFRSHLEIMYSCLPNIVDIFTPKTQMFSVLCPLHTQPASASIYISPGKPCFLCLSCSHSALATNGLCIYLFPFS